MAATPHIQVTKNAVLEVGVYSKGFGHNVRSLPLHEQLLVLKDLHSVHRADYSRRLRAFQYGFSCKDTIMKGSLHVDLQNQEVEYR